MISVITLTYKRKEKLEEAIESFLRQDQGDCEMIVINDCVDIHYFFDHPSVRIYNFPFRFDSILSKLYTGFMLARNEFMYRLDDDDALGENALHIAKKNIKENPGYEIYRSKNHFFFNGYNYIKEGSSVNNGNIYTKRFIDKIKVDGLFDEEMSMGEDAKITLNCGANIYTMSDTTMIYRWGGGTYHVSAATGISNKDTMDRIDHLTEEEEVGKINLHPKFYEDFYQKIREKDG